MCLSTVDPGGPRRCSGDARTAYAGSMTAVLELERACEELVGLQEPAAPADPADGHSDDPAVGQAPACYSHWPVHQQGNYGQVRISPDGTRAVKEKLVGADGECGQFGAYEAEIAQMMGELGHSPRVHRATDAYIEMDVAQGHPPWKGYKREEDEESLNTAQATKAAAAVRALHSRGYAHRDLHALQWIVHGDDVQLVDFGMSTPSSQRPVCVMQDLSKSAALIDWRNPDLAEDPYFRLVNKYLRPYREIKGVSKAAKAHKDELAHAYLNELQQLEESNE